MREPEQHDGLYGPDTITWNVNRETVLLAGGGRALLLQVAHPLVAAGVEQHSDYEEDPWGRLYRTLDLTTKIVFGDRHASKRASERIQNVHTSVKGRSDDGVPYFAKDPDLLTWVWATLVDTSILVYGRYVKPLSADDIGRYYDEQKLFAHACGIPEGHYPASYADFVDYFDGMVSGELRVTKPAKRVAKATLRPRVPLALQPVAWSATEVVNLVTVGLLPPKLRKAYGFEWGPRRELLLGTSTNTVRRLIPLLPSLLREFPPARSASKRTEAAAAA